MKHVVKFTKEALDILNDSVELDYVLEDEWIRRLPNMKTIRDVFIVTTSNIHDVPNRIQRPDCFYIDYSNSDIGAAPIWYVAKENVIVVSNQFLNNFK